MVSLGKLIPYIRFIVVSSIICIASYVVHKRVQREYFTRCAADVVQVMFFRNSQYCMVLKNISTMIENHFIMLFQRFVDFTQ